MLTHANAVLPIYHSDKMFHGGQRGEIGVTATIKLSPEFRSKSPLVLRRHLPDQDNKCLRYIA
jgi:hypothetical protein